MESTSPCDASSRLISPVTVDAHPSVHLPQVPERVSSINTKAVKRVTFTGPATVFIYDDSKEIGVVEDSITHNPTLLPDDGDASASPCLSCSGLCS